MKVSPGIKILLDAAPDETIKELFTAYSDIVLLDKKLVGLLYEKAGYGQVVFTVVQLEKGFE